MVTLSNKIRFGTCNSKAKTNTNQMMMIKAKDVKEFIRKLKHQLCGEFSSDPKFNERQINKLAGEKLC